MLSVPVVPAGYALAVFVLLVVLLVQKEILRAMGRSGPRRWRLATNTITGVLLLLYGLILLSRLLSLAS